MIKGEIFNIDIKSKKHPIYLRYSGKGSAILFLHGWSHSGERWMEIMKHLSKRYKVFAPDLPGFGQSLPLNNNNITINNYSDIIAELIKSIEEKNQIIALVGDSFGAIIILDLLKKGRIHSKKLMLSGCPVYGIPLLLHLGRVNGLVSILLKALRMFPAYLSTRLIKILALGTINKFEDIDYLIVEDVLRADPKTAEILLKEIIHYKIPYFDQSDRQFSIGIVRGEKDRIVSRETSVRLAKMLGASYYEIHDAAHMPMLENVSEYMKILLILLHS